jgi:hypothetical protein
MKIVDFAQCPKQETEVISNGPYGSCGVGKYQDIHVHMLKTNEHKLCVSGFFSYIAI